MPPQENSPIELGTRLLESLDAISERQGLVGRERAIGFLIEQWNEEQERAFSRLRFHCPQCGEHMKVRTSKTHLPVFRELYLHCSSEWECGYRCKAELAVTEALAPTRRPNPDVDVKTSPWLLNQVRLDLEEMPLRKEKNSDE